MKQYLGIKLLVCTLLIAALPSCHSQQLLTKVKFNYDVSELELINKKGKCFVKVSGFKKAEPGIELDIPSPCYIVPYIDDEKAKHTAFNYRYGDKSVIVAGGVTDKSQCTEEAQGVKFGSFGVAKAPYPVKGKASLNKTDSAAARKGVCPQDGLSSTDPWYVAVWLDSK